MQRVSGTINPLGELRVGAAAGVVDVGDLPASPGGQVAADQVHRGVIFAGQFQNQDLLWISPAAFALGPMCTMSVLPRYIQCTGKPKSGCGPGFMPSTRAYQSRVASISSAATRKCSMCERGMH